MIRKFGTLFAGVALLSSSCWANSKHFDVYGVDDAAKQRIHACCSDMLDQYFEEMTRISPYQSKADEKNEPDLKELKKVHDKIMSSFKEIDDFSVVELSIIYYPDKKKAHGTVDLVRKKDSYRIPEQKKRVQASPITVSKETETLFKIWANYDDKYQELLQKGKVIDYRDCPVLHCKWSFSEEERKELVPLLTKGAAKHAKELMQIAKNSPDDSQRAEAIFLLGNGNNPQELVDYLVDFIDDPSDLVRNNVMRVLGFIVDKHPVKNVDVNKVIKALNYPYVTDRNKAGFILWGIAKSDKGSHKIIVREAGENLLKLLELKQPNNHDFGYLILKEVSGQTYGEHDYERWAEWVYSQQG